MLADITPLILTFNEEANINRVLAKLTWAQEVLIVDSGSTDRTHEIAQSYPNVRIVTRVFDSHAAQWNFGLHETSIRSDWVLALDADYVLTDELIEDIRCLPPNADVAGYWMQFRYCIFGKPLRGSLYPPVVTLYKRDSARYIQDGHTQRVVIDGQLCNVLKNPIWHDDRKSLARWLVSQDRYAKLEAELIRQRPFRQLRWQDKMRKLVIVSPLLVPFYCLFVKKGIFDGWPGIYYAAQRTTAELILSLKLIEFKYMK